MPLRGNNHPGESVREITQDSIRFICYLRTDSDKETYVKLLEYDNHCDYSWYAVVEINFTKYLIDKVTDILNYADKYVR